MKVVKNAKKTVKQYQEDYSIEIACGLLFPKTIVILQIQKMKFYVLNKCRTI